MINSRPVYLSGLYRSGTTLLSKIVDSSPSFDITYGTVHFMRNSYAKYRPIEENFGQLIRDTSQRINEKWEIKFDGENLINELSSSGNVTEAIVYDRLMRAFLNLDDNARWGEKTNVQWEGILPFTELYPNGKVIHIIRDPRAVLASWKHFTYLPDLMYLDAIFAALAMFNYVESEKLAEHPQVMLLGYEKLASNPEESIREICDFLEISFSEEMLSLDSNSSGDSKPYDANSSFHEKKKDIDTTSVEIWKDKLEAWEIYLTEMVLKQAIVKHGYKLSGIDLSEEDFSKLYRVLHDDYVSQRYRYWLRHGDGQQAFPDTKGAYQDQ